MSKKIIRKNLLILRKNNFRNISINYSLIKAILKENKLLKKKIIGAYFPINYEIDCFEDLKKFEKNGYKISLPIIKKKYQMDFYEWSFNKPLNVNFMGIPEPCKFKKVYPDILLVPLVAFDQYKYRLGYGGGYYDRYIEKLSKLKKIITIGLAYSFQFVKKFQRNNHDKKLNYIVTENYIVK